MRTVHWSEFILAPSKTLHGDQPLVALGGRTALRQAFVGLGMLLTTTSEPAPSARCAHDEFRLTTRWTVRN